jgi:hypothetical protein
LELNNISLGQIKETLENKLHNAPSTKWLCLAQKFTNILGRKPKKQKITRDIDLKNKKPPLEERISEGNVQHAFFLCLTVASAAAAAIDVSICPIPEGHNDGKWRTVAAVSWRILQHHRLNLPISKPTHYHTAPVYN